MSKRLIFKKKLPYNYNNILDLYDCSGVYVFFKKSGIPIYVGMARSQSIKRRIMRYMKFHENHNTLLASYIRSSKFSIYFSIICIKKSDEIREIESFLIKRFQPICNNDRDKKRRLISNRFLNYKVVI